MPAAPARARLPRARPGRRARSETETCPGSALARTGSRSTRAPRAAKTARILPTARRRRDQPRRFGGGDTPGMRPFRRRVAATRSSISGEGHRRSVLVGARRARLTPSSTAAAIRSRSSAAVRSPTRRGSGGSSATMLPMLQRPENCASPGPSPGPRPHHATACGARRRDRRVVSQVPQSLVAGPTSCQG